MGTFLTESVPVTRQVEVDVTTMQQQTRTDVRTVTECVPTDGLGADELLRLAAAVEVGSEHPLGKAVVEEARRRGFRVDGAQEFRATAGGGVVGVVDGHKVAVGRVGFLSELGISPDGLASTGDALAGNGKTPLYVAVDGRPAKELKLHELRRRLRDEAPGTVVTFRVVRQGSKPQQLKVTLRDLI